MGLGAVRLEATGDSCGGGGQWHRDATRADTELEHRTTAGQLGDDVGGGAGLCRPLSALAVVRRSPAFVSCNAAINSPSGDTSGPDTPP